jgi:CO/xanthine dehydrogenase FAD-binding subunit
MAVQPNQVFFPASYPELFAAWIRCPGATPFAGGTGIIRRQGGQTLELPPIILSLEKLPELRKITRTERYLEIGAMTTLGRIIRLGKIVPEILTRCLENIANPHLRGIATIGGNICFSPKRLDVCAALTALDAQYEIRGAQSSRWVSASRFSSLPSPSALGPQELLTRIRVPLDKWDYSAYRKFSDSQCGGSAAIFLMQAQKNALTCLRVVYKNGLVLRDKNSEALLAGKQLPLSRKIAADFINHWDHFLSGLDALSRRELRGFIEMNIYRLSE